ncbi:MAG: CBS domain-containing protein [Acidimicrobiia bacterium]
MPESIAEVMTRDPLTVPADATATDAARIMRDGAIGDVIVMKSDGGVCGIVTDRDLALRVVAEGRNPTTMTMAGICGHHVVSISSGEPVSTAVRLMREHDVRRLPVVDHGQLVGIVSLGDLALDRDPMSALADISAAPPNN